MSGFIKPYRNVMDYELLPHMGFGGSKHELPGKVHEMQDFKPSAPESLARLQAVIDEAFGRSGKPAPGRHVRSKGTK